jgi:beta-glucosidase
VFSSPNPLWAFGHGLSYTTFDLVSAIADKTHYQAHDTIAVKVKIANSGEVVGKEVVQLYIRDVVSTVMTPIKQLKPGRNERDHIESPHTRTLPDR